MDSLQFLTCTFWIEGSRQTFARYVLIAKDFTPTHILLGDTVVVNLGKKCSLPLDHSSPYYIELIVQTQVSIAGRFEFGVLCSI